MCNNKNMKKIAIFGGSFNPVHKEHIAVALSSIKELNLDKLFVVPTYVSPHKSKASISPEHRFNMLKQTFCDNDKIEVSDFEIKNGGKSYSYITAEYFKKNYDAEVYMIVGGDMLVSFKSWKYPQRILDSVTLCVFSREQFDFSLEKEQEYFRKNFKKEFIKLQYNGKEQSSTKIRVYSALGLAINEFTSEKVEKYIKEHNLYQGGRLEQFVRANLKEKRLIHTANVIVCALKKAKELNLDEEKVYTACLLHDVAKYMDYKSVKGFSLPYPDMPEAVIHSYLGAYVAQNVLKIEDMDIIGGIKHHTAGKEDMSLLEKLVFVADMIEEGRDYLGVEKLRKLYEEDFEKCFYECVKEEMLHLKNKGTKIFFQTEKCYEYYKK